MTDNLIFGDAYLLSGLDMAMAAGGYQDEQPGEGGGPSSAEMTIEALYSNWGSQVIGGDEYSAFMADGTHFFDSDSDGYYDYAERGVEGGVWVFDPETETWDYRA